MPVADVGDILEGYARRGVFRAFSREDRRGRYRLLWHRDQVFDLRFDRRRQRLRIACLLPEVPAASPMYRDLKAWLRARRDEALPEHRRCNPDKVALSTYNRGGEVALTLAVLDGDVAYGVRKLVSLVNELYLDFLSSGLYYDWSVETFGLDPDRL